jgi:HSP20 family protein
MSIELWRTRPYTTPLSQVIDRMFEQTFSPFTEGGSADGGSTGYQSLPVNVWETEAAYYAMLMAPGLDEQTMDVTFHDDSVAVEGTLTFQVPEAAKVVWQEFNPGPARLRRSLRLGVSVEASKVEAVYRNGLLVLTLPKAEFAKPRRIHVTLTSGDNK